ncbi:hypothetical protein DFA_02723 [Cavenderia fasciculata]|uniref:Prenyltransferase alpha-alpha toroid domain-containing protein n=1 Tax=Cavenderia fasciculata TaxID=261658 RepID=F4PHZ3_CACFS|nr:uncharacterized protein DFA_02723 [Cavenderia fasciculata]EGG24480.1 hypothetical protein DFA_02723 [Cavenderia fasciculata]|eukprot:XP_004362331.1 hypothetical protein DFA_02723 [Cavenderia fasciculata]
MSQSFEIEKHIKYIKRNLMALPSPYTSALPNHLSIVYFMLSGLDILDRLDQEIDDTLSTQIKEFVYSRQILPYYQQPDDNIINCGFRGANFIGQPFDNSVQQQQQSTTSSSTPSSSSLCLCQSYPIVACDQSTLANSYCALMILRILRDDLGRVNKKSITNAMKHLQQPDGSYVGASGGGESDMRYLYTACAISFLLEDWSGIDIDLALQYIRSSFGYEFAFGQGPLQEAHGGSTYCAIAALSLLGLLDQEFPKQSVKREKLVQWLVMKQISGFSGRTNKDPDTCYSFWIGASLDMLGAYHLVDSNLVSSFILGAQHPAIGGISKIPDSFPDALHSYMSFSGLSIIQNNNQTAGQGEKFNFHLQSLNCSIGLTNKTANTFLNNNK